MRAGAWEPDVCICLGGRGRRHWRCCSSLPVLSVLAEIWKHHWVGLIDICADCLPVVGRNPAGLGQLDECSRQGTPERRWHFLGQWGKFKDLGASKEKECTGVGGSATGSLDPRKFRKRDLNACNLCSGSRHYQLSPHGPQPGLTCPKDMATWAGHSLLSLVRENAWKKWELNLSTTSLDHLLAGSCCDPCLLGKAQLSKCCGELTCSPHLQPPSRAPCAVGHRSRSEPRPWKGAGTPWAGCRPPRGCQPSDDTMLGVLKSPQSKLFCIVHALIPSLVFLLFSAEFVFWPQGSEST